MGAGGVGRKGWSTKVAGRRRAAPPGWNDCRASAAIAAPARSGHASATPPSISRPTVNEVGQVDILHARHLSGARSHSDAAGYTCCQKPQPAAAKLLQRHSRPPFLLAPGHKIRSTARAPHPHNLDGHQP